MKMVEDDPLFILESLLPHLCFCKLFSSLFSSDELTQKRKRRSSSELLLLIIASRIRKKLGCSHFQTAVLSCIEAFIMH